MKITPNYLKTFAVVLSALSGLILAVGVYEDAFVYFGAIYALFMTPVIGWILYEKYAVSFKTGLLIVLWLLAGTGSWYAAAVVVIGFMDMFQSMLFTVALASLVGFSVLWLYVAVLTWSLNFWVYLKKALGVAVLAAACVWVAIATGDEFDGFLDSASIDIIHVVWQAFVSYLIVAQLVKVQPGKTHPSD